MLWCSCRRVLTPNTACPRLPQGTPVSIVVTHMGLANADFVVRENRQVTCVRARCLAGQCGWNSCSLCQLAFHVT